MMRIVQHFKKPKSLYSFVVMFFLLLTNVSSTAQTGNERKLIRKGNSDYENGKYQEAEINYRKALDKNQNSIPGTYNLGNSFYKQEKFEDAGKRYSKIAETSEDKIEKAHSYHNLGNSLLKAGELEKSIEAYKNSLRLNPKDADTRYNLAYAKSMLQKQEQQQQKNQDQDQDQNKENDQENKENKESENNQEQEEKEQQQNNEQQQSKEDKKQEKGEQKKPREQKISKEDAERILQALKNDERELQKKLHMKQGERIVIEKNW